MVSATEAIGKSNGDNRAVDASPERLGTLAKQLNNQMKSSLSELMTVNQQTILLSINARIEAARAGQAGASFEVVAGEMNNLANRTTQVFEGLSNQTQGLINQVEEMSKLLATQVRGTRLGDIALTNVDLIDRNLYERSCDVRWWATDGSIVTAAEDQSKANCDYASERLGQILDSYTVYFDLVLCDLDGTVIANGRPQKFRSRGSNQAESEWFKAARGTSSGEEFGFQSVHQSRLVGGERVLVYSCGVRSGGKADGELLGVLGILFNWDSLAQTIVKSVPIAEDELEHTRVVITDSEGLVLADNKDKLLADTISFSQMSRLYEMKKGFVIDEVDNKNCLCAHALAPGYETYTTGWHSLIIQETNA